MKEYRTKQSDAAGLAPGTLVYIGDRSPQETEIALIAYNAGEYEKKGALSIEECVTVRDRDLVSWINLNGLYDVEMLRQLDQHFGIHPLVLEDILNTEQRPKVEYFDGYIFIVLRMLYLSAEDEGIISEQISLIIGENYCISFQERPGDVFDPIRSRIQENKGRIRKMGSDYLAYALLDAIVDNYYVVMESFADRIEELEEQLMGGRDGALALEIHRFKRAMIDLRKQIWPLREVIGRLLREESPLVRKTTEVYLRDVYDHIIQVMDNIETFRDMLSGLHDMYLSAVSNRMNEIMKVLTIFAAIFIPLTFIAGIYGMNFDYMPELHWRWGYFLALGVMGLTGFGMVLYFKKKRWF